VTPTLGAMLTWFAQRSAVSRLACTSAAAAVTGAPWSVCRADSCPVARPSRPATGQGIGLEGDRARVQRSKQPSIEAGPAPTPVRGESRSRADGERRTRTADTSIFRTMAQSRTSSNRSVPPCLGGGLLGGPWDSAILLDKIELDSGMTGSNPSSSRPSSPTAGCRHALWAGGLNGYDE
jgi:hypothetical protein